MHIIIRERLLVTCVASSLVLLSLSTSFGDAQLITEMHTVTAENGKEVDILCEATVRINNVLTFTKGTTPLMIMQTTSLDDPNFIDVYRKAGSVTGTITSPSADGRSVNATLKFMHPEVTKRMADTFLCQLTTDSEQETARIDLNVEGPPEDVRIDLVNPEDVGIEIVKDPRPQSNAYSVKFLVKVNMDIRTPFDLRCAALEANPIATIVWKGQDIESLEYLELPSDNGTISVDRAPGENGIDGSEHLCITSNHYGRLAAGVKFISEYAPQFISVTPDTEIFPAPGSELRVKCEFRMSPVVPVTYVKVIERTDQWARESTTSDTDEFVIENIDFSIDIGMYKCVAENKHGRAEGTFTILGHPKKVELIFSESYSTSADFIFKVHSFVEIEFVFTIDSANIETVSEGNQTVVSNQTGIESDRHESRIISKVSARNYPDVQYEYTLMELDPETDYTVSLTARNAHGQIQSEDIVFRTKAEGVTRPYKATTAARLDPYSGATVSSVSSLSLAISVGLFAIFPRLLV